ncbi:hypothetical protein G6F68_019839 [Rhizopus microsporus]|nr:hypothetical protein G6F68_019839 [Rhizopus microsporus]
MSISHPGKASPSPVQAMSVACAVNRSCTPTDSHSTASIVTCTTAANPVGPPPGINSTNSNAPVSIRPSRPL